MMKRIVIFLLITVVILGLSGCGKSKSELRKDLQDVQQELEKTKQELEDYEGKAKSKIYKLQLENDALKQQLNKDIWASYISIRFKPDGKYYKLSDEVKVYADPGCEEKLNTEEVKLISPEIDDPQRDNGYTVYVALTDNGLVFFSEYPKIIEIIN